MNEQTYKYKGDGLLPNQKKLGKKMFQAYQETYNIESASDLPLLEELIYRELRQIEIKEQISDFKKDAEEAEKIQGIKAKNTVPNKFVNALDENLEQIIKLKETLGLFRDNEQKGIYEHIKVLEKKFKIWRAENQASRQFICPHCSEMILLVMRTEAYDALKHPQFRDKYLYNQHVWDLFKEGKLTELDVAKILLGKQINSTDYVEWLEKKIDVK